MQRASKIHVCVVVVCCWVVVGFLCIVGRRVRGDDISLTEEVKSLDTPRNFIWLTVTSFKDEGHNLGTQDLGICI